MKKIIAITLSSFLFIACSKRENLKVNNEERYRNLINSNFKVTRLGKATEAQMANPGIPKFASEEELYNYLSNRKGITKPVTSSQEGTRVGPLKSNSTSLPKYKKNNSFEYHQYSPAPIVAEIPDAFGGASFTISIPHSPQVNFGVREIIYMGEIVDEYYTGSVVNYNLGDFTMASPSNTSFRFTYLEFSGYDYGHYLGWFGHDAVIDGNIVNLTMEFYGSMQSDLISRLPEYYSYPYYIGTSTTMYYHYV